jgi:DNA-directed RNA polymerase subunit RPC12/RpoP
MMKVLKTEQEYIYEDFKALQCGICKKKLWDKGAEINKSSKIRCPQCGTFYTFEAIRWRVSADIPGE